MKRKTSARPAPFSSNDDHAAETILREQARDGGGIRMLGIAGEKRPSTRGWAASQEATLQALAHCRSTRSARVLMPRMVR